MEEGERVEEGEWMEEVEGMEEGERMEEREKLREGNKKTIDNRCGRSEHIGNLHTLQARQCLISSHLTDITVGVVRRQCLCVMQPMSTAWHLTQLVQS